MGKELIPREEGEVSESDGKEESDSDSSSEECSDTSSDSEFDDGYDENLMGDEDDRRRLNGLSEKERETEIFKRIEQRDLLKTRWEIERKLKLARRGEKTIKPNKQKKKKSSVSKKLKQKYKDENTEEIVPIVEKEPNEEIVMSNITQDMELPSTIPEEIILDQKLLTDDQNTVENLDHKERSKERKKNVEMNRTDDKRSTAMAMLKAKREGKAKRGIF